MRWMILTVAMSMALGCSKKESATATATVEAPPKTAAATPTAPAPAPAPTPSVAKKAADVPVVEGDAQHEDDDVLAQLVGIWRVDLEELAKDPSITKLSDKERPEALALMRQTFQSMAFEYAADGKLRIFLGSQIRSGTYRVDGSDDDGVSLTTILGTGANKIESKTRIEFDGAAAVVTEEGQPTLRLLRGIPTPPGAVPPQ